MSPQINRRVSGRPQSTGEKDEAHILEGTKRERPNISLKRVPEGGQRSEGRHSGSMSQESPTKDRGARNDRYDGAEAYGQDHSGSYSKSGIHSATPASRYTKEESFSPAHKSTKEATLASRPRTSNAEPSYSASRPSNGVSSPLASNSSKLPSSPRPAASKKESYPLTSTAPTGSSRTSKSKPSREMEKSQIQWLSRPAYGKTGDVVNLQANYFRVDLDSSVQLYRYHVHVLPEPKTARQRQRAFELFIKEEPAFQDSRRSGVPKVYATDYRSTLVTVEPLELGEKGRSQCQVAYYESEEDEPKKIPSVHNHIFTISLAKTQPLPLQKLMNCLTSTTTTRPSFSLKESILQLLNIVVSQKPLEITGVAETEGRNEAFTERENEPVEVLGGGLVALKCHSTRLRTASPSLLINISPKVASFYREGSLVHLIRDFRARCKDTAQLQDFLKGLRVQVLHLKSTSGRLRTKTITGLALLPILGANAEQVRFIWEEKEEKKEISIVDYYQEKYAIKLESSREPVINVGDKRKPTYLPPELCIVLPRQKANMPLSSDQAKIMAKICLREVGEEVKSTKAKLSGAARALAIDAKDSNRPAAFGVSIQQNVLKVEGRVLPAPPVQYADMKFRPDFGSWNLKENRKFRTGAGITAWTYREIQLPNQGPLNSQVKGFVAKLERSYQSTISSHHNAHAPLILNCTCPAKQFADLDGIFNQCRTNHLNTLLLILPNHSHTLFASIKYLADVRYGIKTICIEASTMQKHIGKSWYAATIAQKLNTQGGGVNQCLPEKELEGLVPKSTMIVGIDVTNPFPKGQANASISIIGVVASNKSDCTQWPASVRRQENPEKISLDLKEMLIERLQCWKKTNKGVLPDQILIYSNGVTEDHPLIAKETKAVGDAIAEQYSKTPLPKTTIMIVNKSHHTRFYPADRKAADGQSGNPKVGTVVDQVITSQVPWDFYLQSHPGTPKNGTVRPAHYVVIKDDIELGADGVQKLTNSLCYISGRGTRALSTVPPAHYANLVCERARCYVQASSIASDGSASGSGSIGSNGSSSQWTRGVHTELQDSMWYI